MEVFLVVWGFFYVGKKFEFKYIENYKKLEMKEEFFLAIFILTFNKF